MKRRRKWQHAEVRVSLNQYGGASCEILVDGLAVEYLPLPQPLGTFLRDTIDAHMTKPREFLPAVARRRRGKGLLS